MSYYRGEKHRGAVFCFFLFFLLWALLVEREGGVPASARSFCSSLLALRGKEEVLNLFSLFTAECDPSCFTLISWVAGGTFLLEPCRNKSRKGRAPVTAAGQGEVVPAPWRKQAQESLYSSVKCGDHRRRGEARRGEERRGEERKRRERRRRGEGVVVKGQVPFRIRSGDSQWSNLITVAGVLHRICWQEFGMDPGGQNNWAQMRLIKLSMGTNSRSSNQSIRPLPIWMC